MSARHRRISLRQQAIRAIAVLGLVATGLTAVAVSLSAAPAQGVTVSGTPFTCNPSLYFQSIAVGSGATQLYEEVYNNTGGVTYTQIGTNPSGTYNAIGYDSLDNFIWGTNSSGHLVEIDATGTVTDTGFAVPQKFISGAFDPNGNYLATETGVGGASDSIYSLNIASGTATTTPMSLNGGTYTQTLTDWTYVDGFLWSQDPSTGDILRIDPSSGAVTQIVQTFMPNGTYGAAWTFGNGNLVFSNNNSGSIYQLAINNPSSATPTVTGVSIATGNPATTNDGTSCFGPSVDLGITKSGPASVAAGAAMSWTLTVTDDSGTADSSGYTVNDAVPAGYTNVASTTAGCTVTGNNVSCVEPGINAGVSAQISITATAPPAPSAGAYTNTATVTGNESDPNPANNSASLTTEVGFADVSLSKAASKMAPTVGSQDTYTLTATSSSTSTAVSGQVVVTDVLPTGLAYVSSTPSAGTVGVSGQTVTWTVANLAPNASATLQITVKVNTSAVTSNTATFTQTTPSSTGKTSGSSNTVTVDPSWADVSVAKAVTAGNSEVGTDDTYTLTAANSASSTAASGQVAVTDVVPSGLAIQSTTASTGTVNVSGQTVTWTISTLAAGASSTLNIVVKVNTVNVVDNHATFTQQTPNDTGATTGTSNTVPLTPVYANVTVTKGATTTTPNVGATDSYMLTATNAGPDSAGQVVVTDVVPAGLTIQSTNATVGTVGVSGQTVTWTIATLGPPGQGNSGTLTISVLVDATTPVANSASFTQAVPNSQGATTGSSNTVTLTPQFADVTVAKTVSGATPTVGSPDTYTLTATNSAGSSAASGQVVVTDVLPAGMTYVSSTPSTGTIGVTGQTVTWTIPTIAAGASATLQIAVTVASDVASTNTASFTQTVPDSTGGTTGTSNGATVTPAFAAVTLQKAVTNATPGVGQADTFTLTAANDPSSTADSGLVTVNDVLPAGLTYVSSSPSNTCTGPCVAVSGQVVTWTIDDLAAGASATLQIVVTVDSTTSVTNVASFSQAEPNGTGATTGSSNSVTLTPQYAVVTLTKTAATTTPLVGARDTFTLTVTNTGPDLSGQVAVTDVLPAGLTFDSAVQSGGDVSESGQTVTWTIPDLQPTDGGSTANLQIVVTVNTSSPVTNTATFTQATPNATGGTTGSSNGATLTPQYAAVTVKKTASSTDPALGSDDTFTITATNAGPAAAGKVVVTDVLASGLSYKSSSAAGGTVSVSGQTVTWTIPDLGPPADGNTATLKIVVLVDTTSSVQNAVTFTQTTPDASGGTTGSSGSVTVAPTYAVLQLSKTVSSATADLGAKGTYTITVTNTGPDTAGAVAVTDALPSADTFVSAATSAGTASESTSGGVETVSWAVGSLAVGSKATMQLVVTFTSAGTVKNTASATDSTFNRSPGGEVAGASASLTVVKPVVVPGTHTGEPWSGWPYWALVALLGLAGMTFFGRGYRRRRSDA